MQPGGGAAAREQAQGGAAAGAPGNSDLTAGLWSLLAQALTIFQRSLTTMQIQVAGLLQFAVPLFPTAEVRRPPRHPCGKRGNPRPGPR